MDDPQTRSARLGRLATILPRAVGLESSGGRDNGDAIADYLANEGKARELDRVTQMAQCLDASQRRELIGTVRTALTEVGQRRPTLSVDAHVGLEALVMLTGRPALRVRDDAVDLADPHAVQWRSSLVYLGAQADFKRQLQAVGRIDADGVQLGTGFVVGPGLLLTNRHVLQQFAAPIPRNDNPASWVITTPEVLVDFADTPGASTRASKFKILGVASSGSQPILAGDIDLQKVDMALLRVSRRSLTGAVLPAPLCLAGNSDSLARRREVFCVGYPARPGSLPADDGGEIDMSIVQRLTELFGTDFGTKYLAPGQIISSDAHTLRHDATTLGGNSGSCLLGTEGRLQVVGLHIGGSWRKENYAHALPALRDSFAFGDDVLFA